MRPPNVTLEATGQVETHRVGEKIDFQKKHGREVGSLEDLKTRGCQAIQVWNPRFPHH